VIETRPLISAIIPARNAGATLAQTIDSLLAQSVTDWEAIIVDDGSSDDTAAIITRYAAGDARFVTMAGPGRGVAAARNVGIAAARGTWLHFLDADDWLTPPFYTKLLAALARRPGVGIGYCNYHRVYPDGLAPPLALPQPAKDAFEEFARNNMVSPNGILVNRALVLAAGMLDETLTVCEDWDLWQRVARVHPKWVHVDEYLVYYRLNRDSLSTRADALLDCSRRVIARGFAPDERVAALNPVRAGAPSAALGSEARAFAMVTMWTAGMVCGAGRDARFAREVLTPFAGANVAAQELAGVLFGGVMRGGLLLPHQVVAGWEDFAPRVESFLAWLAECWGDEATVRAVRNYFERTVIGYDRFDGVRSYGGTLAADVQMAALPEIMPPAGMDRLDLRLRHGRTLVARLHIGLLGGMTAAQMRGLVAALPLPADRPWLRRRDLTLSKRNLRDQAMELARDGRAVWRWWQFRRGRQKLLADGAGEAGVPAAGHAAVLEEIMAAARMEAEREAEAPAPPPPKFEEGGVDLADRRGHFDQLFEQEDPWNYTSPYELEKYQRQLDLLPVGAIENALELACAEGHFTAMLAGRVGHLIAADISAKALARARARCAAWTNIEYHTVDLAKDALPRELDLIVCSEVLYYLADQAELRLAAQAIAGALRLGGALVTANPYLLRDDKTRTGFDWDTIYGAAVIHRTLCETPGLVLEASIETELYRIDRFRRVDEGARAGAPAAVKHLPVTEELDPKMARHIVWGGARLRRRDVAWRRRWRMPVLTYHGVSKDGPEALAPYRISPDLFRAQMRWLRANGFHSVTSADLAWHLREGRVFRGRPVMLTFDDGFQDFAEYAWPILQAHDFTAEMFVVTDYVGKSAEWDAQAGAPTPLMAAGTLAALAQDGAVFGSHLATHRASDGLTSRELAEELARSRAKLERWLGKAPMAFAAPYAITDGRLRHMAASCGYEIGFGGGEGPVRLRMDPLDLPRILVRGDKPLKDFIKLMRRF
jgi:peptidoglycan/xylan/chitin deacetylase (PgdA/CDA1 family)/predicted TPR repeat methyltransferase